MATTAAEVAQAAISMATGMVKGNTADTLGVPVDLINTAISPVTKALGIHSDTPFGGSGHFRTLFGMDVEDKNIAETAGSMISVGGAAKAMIVGAARMGKAVDLPKTAELMANPKTNAAAVYNLTGVYKGEEGKLRSVLSDSKANIKILPDGNNDWRTLEDILDHPELYDAYPELKNLTVANKADMPKKSGAFLEAGSKIEDSVIRLSAKSNPSDYLSTLLHETQHAIQSIEDWTRGGSSEQFLPANIDRTKQAVQSAVSSGRNSADPAIRDAAERFKERFNAKIQDAHTKYENIPGEQEARFTQASMNMDQNTLAGGLLNLLKQNLTPQNWDTQQLPSKLSNVSK